MTLGRPRHYSTEAVVLRFSDIGEADRVITFLTPTRGLLRAWARGVRRPASKLGGHLDLLRHVSISLTEGRTLDGVSQAHTLAGYRSFERDLTRMTRGLYMAELAERFSVEEASNRPVFRLLIEVLDALDQDRAGDILLPWYEMRLLTASGFQPEVTVCAECGGELVPREHTFSATRGGIVCPACRTAGGDALLPAKVEAIKLLRYLGHASLDAVSVLRVRDDEARQVERLLRAHLRHVLDRAVRSTAFLDEVRGWSQPQPGEVLER